MPLTVTVMVIMGGWHYLCGLMLEEELQDSINARLAEILESATAVVSIQPITNLVRIEIDRPVSQSSNAFQDFEDALVAVSETILEPQMERSLATAARQSIDIYAMVVPYHVAIDVRKVRRGYSRLVEDVQKQLIRLGFQIGEADGVNGQKTTSAIAIAQGQLGMNRDGQASPELLRRLSAAEPAASSR